MFEKDELRTVKVEVLHFENETIAYFFTKI